MRELGRGGALVAAAVAHLENKANHRPASKKSSNLNTLALAEMPVETKKPCASTSADCAKESSSSDNEEYRKSDKMESTASESVRSSERDSEESEDSSSSASSGQDSGQLGRITEEASGGAASIQHQGSRPDKTTIHHLLLQHILILATVAFFSFYFV